VELFCHDRHGGLQQSLTNHASIMLSHFDPLTNILTEGALVPGPWAHNCSKIQRPAQHSGSICLPVVIHSLARTFSQLVERLAAPVMSLYRMPWRFMLWPCSLILIITADMHVRQAMMKSVVSTTKHCHLYLTEEALTGKLARVHSATTTQRLVNWTLTVTVRLRMNFLIPSHRKVFSGSKESYPTKTIRLTKCLSSSFQSRVSCWRSPSTRVLFCAWFQQFHGIQRDRFLSCLFGKESA
jgi:hypothetical protein